MTPEPIIAGDVVEVQTYGGEWLSAIARSSARYDVLNAIDRRRPMLTISVEVPGWDHPVNWPAEDVRHRQLKEQPLEFEMTPARRRVIDRLAKGGST